MLDDETCEKLFQLPASVQPTTYPTLEPIPETLQGNARRQLAAALGRALEKNGQFFQQERDSLDAWAHECPLERVLRTRGGDYRSG